MQQDPAPGQSTSPITVTNKYTYVGNNPINNIDPSGRSFLGDFGDIFKVIAIVAVAAFTGGAAAGLLVSSLGIGGSVAGILVGAAAGAIAGGLAGGLVGAVWEGALNGGSYRDGFSEGFKMGAIAGAMAGAFAGYNAPNPASEQDAIVKNDYSTGEFGLDTIANNAIKCAGVGNFLLKATIFALRVAATVAALEAAKRIWEVGKQWYNSANTEAIETGSACSGGVPGAV